MGLMNVLAMHQFENIVTKQYKLGCDFESKHLQKMKAVNECLHRDRAMDCNQSRQCMMCSLYGEHSCQSIMCSNYKLMNHHNGNVNVDEVVRKKYLALKQKS